MKISFNQLGLFDDQKVLTITKKDDGQFEFVNEHGERFFVKVDKKYPNIARVKSTETNNKWLYAVDGAIYGFLHGKEELEYLSNIIKKEPLYYSLNLKVNSSGNYKNGLTTLVGDSGVICPVCLNVCGDDYEKHHVVPAYVGGGDGKQNMLCICTDCHAVESHSATKKSQEIRNICLYHQLITYGPAFFIHYKNTRYQDRHIKYSRKGMEGEGIFKLLKTFMVLYGEKYAACEVESIEDAANYFLHHVSFSTNQSMHESFTHSYHTWQAILWGRIPHEDFMMTCNELSPLSPN